MRDEFQALPCVERCWNHRHDLCWLMSDLLLKCNPTRCCERRKRLFSFSMSLLGFSVLTISCFNKIKVTLNLLVPVCLHMPTRALSLSVCCLLLSGSSLNSWKLVFSRVHKGKLNPDMQSVSLRCSFGGFYVTRRQRSLLFQGLSYFTIRAGCWLYLFWELVS